jgi:hypothetical protein
MLKKEYEGSKLKIQDTPGRDESRPYNDILHNAPLLS